MIDDNHPPKLMVGLGELLWDLLPEGAQLGGAPANFAVMAGRLGDRAVVASRVGADALGVEAGEQLASRNVDTGYLQTDAELPTGTVTVAFDNGEPHYTIHEPAAWDRLELSPAWQALAQEADAVCFGTLAQRGAVSQRTILAFLDATRPQCVRILDVNLRAPFWSAEILRESLGRATILKLNAGELPEVLRSSGACRHPAPGVDEEEVIRGARRLMDRYPARMVCVTLGSQGSMLVTRSQRDRHHGFVVDVRDTVGAGDAFTAALAHYYLHGAPLPMLSDAANRWGAWVASQAGAMPPVTAETVAAMAAGISRRNPDL